MRCYEVCFHILVACHFLASMTLRVQAFSSVFGLFRKPLSLFASGQVGGVYRLIVICGFGGRGGVVFGCFCSGCNYRPVRGCRLH